MTYWNLMVRAKGTQGTRKTVGRLQPGVSRPALNHGYPVSSGLQPVPDGSKPPPPQAFKSLQQKIPWAAKQPGAKVPLTLLYHTNPKMVALVGCICWDPRSNPPPRSALHFIYLPPEIFGRKSNRGGYTYC